MEGSGTSWDWVFDPDHVARITAKLRDGHGKEEWPEPGNQSAAVLVPIMAVDGVPSVLFTLRSRDLSRHRNQVRCVYVAYPQYKAIDVVRSARVLDCPPLSEGLFTPVVHPFSVSLVVLLRLPMPHP